MTVAWSSATLGELCTVSAGGTPARSRQEYWDGDVPWVKISDMLQGEITTTEEQISRIGLENSAAKLLPSGTLILSIFATIGRTAILGIEAATNQAIVGLGIKDKSRLDQRYLRRFLELKSVELEAQARGVAQANINGSILKSLSIPLPDLPAQRRIADVLDCADALRAKRRLALAKLDALTQSIFIDLFGDPIINPKGWPEKLVLGEVAEIVSGITKGRKLNGQKVRPVPYLAVANVQDRTLDLSTVKTIEATETEIERYRLQADDLVLTEGGDPDKLGRGSLWRAELLECIHQNHIFRVRFTSDRVVPLFVNWLIGSARGKSYFLKSSKQTTGIASINMTQLRAFPLLIPPVKLQREFRRRIAAVEKLKAIQRASLAEMDALFASLQHRAFRGEL